MTCSSRRAAVMGSALLFVSPALARAQSVEIDHKAVGCIVVGKYPKMSSCFTPASGLARARVYFRPEGVPSWYYVDMKSDQPCYAGILPRPGKKLVGKKIEYYVEAQDRNFNAGRTAEYAPIVVSSAQECKKEVPVAPFVNNATVAVFPSVPAGFVGAGGLGAGAIIGVAAAGAAAAGTAVAVSGGGSDAPTTMAPAATPTTTTPVAGNVTTISTFKVKIGAMAPDADMARAIPVIAESFYGCAGERCLAGSVLVPVGGAHAEARDRLVEAARTMTVPVSSRMSGTRCAWPVRARRARHGRRTWPTSTSSRSARNNRVNTAARSASDPTTTTLRQSVMSSRPTIGRSRSTRGIGRPPNCNTTTSPSFLECSSRPRFVNAAPRGQLG